MNTQQIVLTDFTPAWVSGRWFEQYTKSFNGETVSVETVRFPIKGILNAKGKLLFEYDFAMFLHGKSTEWRAINGVNGLHYFYLPSTIEFFTGPFQLDDGTIIWSLGPLRDRSFSFSKIYRSGFMPTPTPMQEADFDRLIKAVAAA